MDTVFLQKIKDELAKNQELAIAVGKNHTMDEMAAALSLYLALKAAGKQVSIASPTAPLVEISNLVGIDKVKTYIDSSGGDLMVSFPYNEGEIEKVSYTLEDGFLNIIVKAGEQGLSFQEKDVKYKRAGGIPKTLFVIGTPRISDLGNLFDTEALKDTIVINIDNKTDNQGFGDIVLVNQSFSSVSEQVADMLSFLQFPIDVDIAQNLFSGIAFATDNFQNQKTSPLAFEMAALFLKKGAVRPKVSVLKVAPTDGSFFQPRPASQQMSQTPFMPSANNRQSVPMQRTSFLQRDKNAYKPKIQPFPRQQQQPPLPKNPQIPPLAVEAKDDVSEEAPPDWLTPKVYKGSTLV